MFQSFFLAFGVLATALVGIWGVSSFAPTAPDFNLQASVSSPAVEQPLPVWNPTKLAWRQATSSVPGSPRDAHTTAVFNGKLYLMGGLDGDRAVNGYGVEYWNAPHFSDIWATADGENWELVTQDAPWGKRRSSSVEIFQNEMWLFAGLRGDNFNYDRTIWHTADGANWATSTLTTWYGREGQASAVFNGKLWFAGGVNFTDRKTLNDVWFSEDGINWQEATAQAPWAKRYDHTLTVFKDKLWLIGGLDFGEKYMNDVWVSTDGVNWELAVSKAYCRERQGTGVVILYEILGLGGFLCEIL